MYIVSDPVIIPSIVDEPIEYLFFISLGQVYNSDRCFILIFRDESREEVRSLEYVVLSCLKEE